jgi:hypothetical protein
MYERFFVRQKSSLCVVGCVCVFFFVVCRFLEKACAWMERVGHFRVLKTQKRNEEEERETENQRFGALTNESF